MDMSYLKDMPIAILGAGAVGKTMAADCALAGKEVRLWDQPRFAKTNFTNIENRHHSGRCTVQLLRLSAQGYCEDRSGYRRHG